MGIRSMFESLPRWLQVLLSRLLALAATSAAFVAFAVWFATEEPSSSRTRHLGIPLVFLAGALLVALAKVVLDPIRVLRGIPLPFESSGESSVFSEDGVARGVRYHYDPRMPRRMVVYCFATATFMGAFVVAGLMFADLSQPGTYVLLALVMLPTVVYAWRGVVVRRRLTREGGLAIEITQEGIRLDGSEVLPWDRIDLLLIDGRSGRHGHMAVLLANALFGVNHIRAAVFDDRPGKAHLTRNVLGAYDRALPGGRDDFIQICRQLRGAASSHPNVRLRVAEDGFARLTKQIGSVEPYSTLEETSIGLQRGAEHGESLRRKDRESPES